MVWDIYGIYDWDIFGMCMGCIWDVFGTTHSTVIRRGRAAPHVFAQQGHSRRACSSACVRTAHSVTEGMQLRVCAQRATVDESVLNEIYLLSPAPTPQRILLFAPCRRALGAHTVGSGLAAKLTEKPL